MGGHIPVIIILQQQTKKSLKMIQEIMILAEQMAQIIVIEALRPTTIKRKKW
jgi:hypothetical protein